jgi:hypothetical protein
MLTFTTDTNQAEKTVATLTANVAALKVEMPREFMAWQVEDMKRSTRTKNLTMLDEDSAMTRIWRLGLETMQRRDAFSRRRTATPIVIRKGQVQHGATTPILSPALFQRLRLRMLAMLVRVVPWA